MDIARTEMQDLVTDAADATDALERTEISVLDVLSGEATWEELDAYRMAS